MPKTYPSHEGFGYAFGYAELSCGAIKGRRIYSLIDSIDFDQPTTDAAVYGTRPYPIKRSTGQMELGQFTIHFSDEGERSALIQEAADLAREAGAAGFRDALWDLTWFITTPDGTSPPIKYELFGCRILSTPVAHQSGEEALGGDVSGSFNNHAINGESPHGGIPTGARG